MFVCHCLAAVYWREGYATRNVCMYVYVCMYVCRDIYVRAAAYSLDCYGGTVIYRRLYRTFQSLVEHRTESVTTMNHELLVTVSSST